MKTRYSADDAPSIAQRLKELEAETTARINGISLEDAKPVEAPADIDYTGFYGYPCGYALGNQFASSQTATIKWADLPQGLGTAWEWEVK